MEPGGFLSSRAGAESASRLDWLGSLDWGREPEGAPIECCKCTRRRLVGTDGMAWDSGLVDGCEREDESLSLCPSLRTMYFVVYAYLHHSVDVAAQKEQRW
ncbi:fungal specific transcription factor [Colletotrichum scovillei]|uniref:Fungal specific transcription factor n=1 Tax=Colletotrichum scovillei TaxID=1209932 RepID=A0A9P7RHV6_9PEZI|nr:fungal specific transcription factor [Colletotrichum scovillei]KAG7076437.1 fungal specific transcription factor [Colletotrichum scovillei]KAG7083521.1 fungal specific transcription factor [Colletotrichum scovillei]